MNAESTSSRVVIVTGVAAGGMGVVIARAFAAEGAALVVADHPRNAAGLDKIVADCQAAGHQMIGVPTDVSDEAQVDGLVEGALRTFSRVDVLVNNAGVMLRKDVFETTSAEWQHIIDVNLTGTWLVDRAVGARMRDQRSGKIINVSSVYADRVGRLPESAYYASKAGIANLTRALAMEFGPFGINVNCIAPGVFYPTNMTAALGDTPDVLAAMTSRTMLGRLGDPATDIDGVVRFLASDEARYITGQTLFVDGGWSAW